MEKTARQKQLIVEKKWDDLENSQKWPPSKGYRLCKIVTLVQKKNTKTHAKNVSTAMATKWQMATKQRL